MVERTAVESRAEEEVAQEKSAWGLGLPYRLVLDVSTIEMNDEQFFQFCAANGDLRIELTAERELIVMPPEGLTTGARSARLSQRLANWAEQDGTGLVFGSSTGFTFPNGAVRSPDASWVPSERWEALPGDEKVRFGHLCPDFVVEIRSPSDRLPDLQAKMAEYIDNGVRLGWLIDCDARTVEVYRPGQEVERLDQPVAVSGGPVLPGFELNLVEIW